MLLIYAQENIVIVKFVLKYFFLEVLPGYFIKMGGYDKMHVEVTHSQIGKGRES